MISLPNNIDNIVKAVNINAVNNTIFNRQASSNKVKVSKILCIDLI